MPHQNTQTEPNPPPPTTRALNTHNLFVQLLNHDLHTYRTTAQHDGKKKNKRKARGYKKRLRQHLSSQNPDFVSRQYLKITMNNKQIQKHRDVQCATIMTREALDAELVRVTLGPQEERKTSVTASETNNVIPISDH